ncbi:WD40-repeat-containing domain protein [Epithele typhae]|uniref:WD40-repeat-containing domain protein n=1 Tax=Epithele typhae TaxID=378194 RepID=UPI002007C3FA|nr:WD40-repeat-containing domain protein [Epithele typhae]KAH9917366.1 WD40-repeat-containing domain protein [Epithele typhae]
MCSVRELRLSPDERYLLSYGWRKEICVWEIGNTLTLRTKISAPTPWNAFGDHSDICSFALSPAGDKIATTSLDGSTCSFWSFESGDFLGSIPFQWPSKWLLRPDFNFYPDGGHLSPHAKYVCWLPRHFSPYHAFLISDPHTGSLIHVCSGHRDSIHTVEWSRCGNFIATSSNDRFIRIWRARDGVCIGCHFFPEGAPSVLVFTGDGESLFLGRENGAIGWLHLCEIDARDGRPCRRLSPTTDVAPHDPALI